MWDGSPPFGGATSAVTKKSPDWTAARKDEESKDKPDMEFRRSRARGIRVLAIEYLGAHSPSNHQGNSSLEFEVWQRPDRKIRSSQIAQQNVIQAYSGIE
jgi:hypothetical protein